MKPEKKYDLIRKYAQELNLLISVWNIEDIQAVRPDLNDEQACEVLDLAERRHDAEYGINWGILRIHANDLYPEPEETATAEGGAS